MEKVWYYLNDDQATGPFNWEGLLSLRNAGIISDETYVHSGSLEEWITFKEAKELSSSYKEACITLPQIKSSDIYESTAFRGSIFGEKYAGWSKEYVLPWRRFGARTLDVITLGGGGFFFIGIALYMTVPVFADEFFAIFNGPQGRIMDTIATLALACLISAVLTGTVGVTPGKFVFGLRVLSPTGNPIGIREAIERESSIFFYGYGMGIPLISLACLIVQYQKLQNNGILHWDENRSIILARPNGSKQYVANAVGVLLIVLGIIIIQGTAAL